MGVNVSKEQETNEVHDNNVGNVQSPENASPVGVKTEHIMDEPKIAIIDVEKGSDREDQINAKEEENEIGTHVDLGDIYPQVSNDHGTYFCYVCYDNIEFKTDKLVTSLGCGHQYCKECFVGYIRNKVTDGQIHLKCFHPLKNSLSDDVENNLSHDMNRKICDYNIPKSEIRAAIDNDTEILTKYERFMSLKGNPNMRECCFCNHIQLGDPLHPSITCDVCQKAYCYYHANAHSSDETCEEYEDKVKEIQQNSVDFISKFSKPCPKCGVAIGKIDGCNHMKCSVCNQAFCWICGKAIEDTVFPSHFQWWNPYGCSNLQMNDAVEPSSCSRWLARILTFFELIILGPLTLASTASSFILCSCCIPHYLYIEDKNNDSLAIKCQRLGSNCLSGWGMFWIAIVFFLPAVFIVLGLVVGFGAAIFAIIYPSYALVRLCRGQYPWPDPVTTFFKTCFDRIYLGCVRIRHLCCLGDIHARNHMEPRPPVVVSTSRRSTVVDSTHQLSSPISTRSSSIPRRESIRRPSITIPLKPEEEVMDKV